MGEVALAMATLGESSVILAETRAVESTTIIVAERNTAKVMPGGESFVDSAGRIRTGSSGELAQAIGCRQKTAWRNERKWDQRAVIAESKRPIRRVIIFCLETLQTEAHEEIIAVKTWRMHVLNVIWISQINLSLNGSPRPLDSTNDG